MQIAEAISELLGIPNPGLRQPVLWDDLKQWLNPLGYTVTSLGIDVPQYLSLLQGKFILEGEDAEAYSIWESGAITHGHLPRAVRGVIIVYELCPGATNAVNSNRASPADDQRALTQSSGDN